MNSKVIVALDYETEAQALSLVDQIDPSLCRLKVGKEMFTTHWERISLSNYTSVNLMFSSILNFMIFRILWQERCVLRLI